MVRLGHPRGASLFFIFLRALHLEEYLRSLHQVEDSSEMSEKRQED